MANTGLDSFNATVQETNELFNTIEQKFEWKDRRDQTYLLVRSVLHALRDRLPPQEAIHFSAQLPLLLKGVFIDGWDPDKTPVKMDKEGFLQRIRENFFYDLKQDFKDVVSTVLQVLMGDMSKGQKSQIKGVLPDDISRMIAV